MFLVIRYSAVYQGTCLLQISFIFAPLTWFHFFTQHWIEPEGTTNFIYCITETIYNNELIPIFHDKAQSISRKEFWSYSIFPNLSDDIKKYYSNTCICVRYVLPPSYTTSPQYVRSIFQFWRKLIEVGLKNLTGVKNWSFALPM